MRGSVTAHRDPRNHVAALVKARAVRNTVRWVQKYGGLLLLPARRFPQSARIIHQPRRSLLPWLLALATLLPVVLWPGDVSWLIDEPRLIANAFYFNQDHMPAHTGLFGNFGVPYGPVPTQTYQLLLGITHDPFSLVVLRGLLCAGLTGIGLIWLARSLGLRAWFAAVILAAPNIVAFHRILWDASFTIPLGALCLAALADFLQTKRPWSLRLCAVCTVLLPINHPQALPLALPVGAYLLWRHRADFRADKIAMRRIGAVLFILHFLYIGAVAGVVWWKLTHGAVNLQYPVKNARWLSMLAPFLGGNLLTGFDYARSVARPDGPAWLIESAMWASRLIYPILWIGIAAAATRIAPVVRTLRAGVAVATRDLFPVLLIACLVVQFIIFTALRIPPGPQYFFGTFALHAALAFFGIEALGKVRLAVPVGALLGATNAFITLGGMAAVHTRGYEAPGWPTMANCLGAVRQLDRYADQVVLTDIELFQRYPQPIRTLRLLSPPPPGPKARNRHLLLTYKRKDGIKTGEIVVVELARDEKHPLGSSLVDITPLPQGWNPDPSFW